MQTIHTIIFLLALTSFASADEEKCTCWPVDPTDKADLCGNDGKDYPSPCWARCKNATAAYYGKCQPDTAKRLEFCWKCTDEYNPVCGNDGVVYGNPCFAECLKRDIVNWGHCSIADASSSCNCGTSKAATPVGVCGNDGVSYGNECYAKCAGKRVISKGKCPQPLHSKRCPCPLTFDRPVCGEHRREFPNECIALQCAHVNIVHQGHCLGSQPSMTDNWLRWELMSACGMDGKIYSSSCEARCKGVTIMTNIFNDSDPDGCKEAILSLSSG